MINNMNERPDSLALEAKDNKRKEALNGDNNINYNIEKTGEKINIEEFFPNKGTRDCMPNIMIIAGWALTLIVFIILSAVNTDNVGFNVFQLITIVDFIISCFFVPKMAECESVIPKRIASLGLIISTILLVFLSTINVDNVGFNACQLLLILDLVTTAVICVKLFKKK